MDGPDHLECVDNDEHCVRVLNQERVQLLLQPPAQHCTFCTEVYVGRCILGDLKQPVLDPKDRILQAEVECGTTPGWHVPYRLSPGHRNR